MDLHHLAIFHAVAESGSVSIGAERLMVSQPAVSKQIRIFERRLDVALFDRHPKGVRLTAAGEVLAGYAKRVFTLVDEAKIAIDDLSALRGGSLSIGAGPTVGNYLLPRVMVRFRQRFPGIRMRIETGGVEILRERLNDGMLDLVLTEGEIDDPALLVETFATDVLVPVASSTNALARQKCVTAKQFCGEPFIARETASAGQSLVERTLRKRGFEVSRYLTLGSTEAIKQAVIAGLGVAMLSRLAVSAEMLAGQIVELPIQRFAISYPLHHARAKARAESRPATALLCLLRDELRREKRARQRHVVASQSQYGGFHSSSKQPLKMKKRNSA